MGAGMPSTIVPTGEERTFGDDELIVSKTDLRGRLTYVNDVFLRVSAFPEADLIGRPHNIIRHPDMPRCVFKLLWDTIQSGEELFAYIVNVARDGAHYWVLAHVTPSFDTTGSVVGYHSNRRTASRSAIAATTELYRELRAAESAFVDPVASIQAGVDRLHAMLDEAGMTFSEWVWSVESRTTEVAA
jgi:PAS domain S-box-containing protein